MSSETLINVNPLKEKIYSRATDERYKQFVIDFNKNKELKEQAKNFGIGEFDG